MTTFAWPRRRGRAVAVLAALLIGVVASDASARSGVIRPPLPSPLPDVYREACPGGDDVAGCYFAPGESDGRRVFARGAVFLASRSLFAKLHEYGHHVDHTYLDASERRRYAATPITSARRNWTTSSGPGPRRPTATC